MPNTWHWDNVTFTPAIPFTIIPAAQRFADASTGAISTFSAPAPTDARLRFSGIGKNLQVSFDGGTTWVRAASQGQSKYNEDSYWSYWTPVPAGTQSIKFRGTEWWGGDWRVKDISIWSMVSNFN